VVSTRRVLNSSARLDREDVRCRANRRVEFTAGATPRMLALVTRDDVDGKVAVAGAGNTAFSALYRHAAEIPSPVTVSKIQGNRPGADTSLMSASQQPNSAIEIVRCIYDAFDDGDTRTPQQYFRDDVDAYVSDFLPWGGVMKGLAAFSEGFQIMTRYVRIAFEPVQLIDSGDDVIAIGQSVGIVHATGQMFKTRTVQVWRVENEKVVAVAYYHDRELATYLAAAAA
jgi:ketosteroid isomerase-like protein